MFLSILAAVLNGSAFAIYLHQIYGGTSVPNPASWTVWVFVSILNALTFWKGSKDPLATAQFFTGSICCSTVWIFSLSTGKFSPLDSMDWIILALGIVACLVWWVKRNAIYGNLVMAVTFLVSAYPTIRGVLQNSNLEHALPWYIWTGAFSTTLINVINRRHESKKKGVQWQFLMVVPIVGIFIHIVVALSVTRWDVVWAMLRK